MNWGELWPILALSAQVSGIAVLISAVIGIPVGTWLGLTNARLRAVMRVLTHTGMALPPVVVGLLIYLLLSRSGPWGELGWLFSVQAMIFAQVILAIPFVVGITMNSVSAIPSDLALQLRGLGASDWQVRTSVLREASPGILLAVAAAVGRSISEVGAVLIVGGNIEDKTRVMTTAIVLETGQGNFEFALVLGGFLLIAAFGVNALILLLQRSQRLA